MIDIPIQGSTRCYSKNEVDNFISNIPIDNNIAGKCLYIQSGNIFQAKLREAGFTITRDKFKADVIIIDDIRKYTYNYSPTGFYRLLWMPSSSKITDAKDYFLELYEDITYNNYKYCCVDNLYKHLYKYDSSYEIFQNLSELFKSNDKDNIKMGMEMMTNCNWEGHGLYLVELFNLYYCRGYSNTIRNNTFKNSVSFRGFLDTLDFNPNSIYLIKPDHYRQYCSKQEHHDYVLSKYKDEIEGALSNLCTAYKIKIDNIKYSIDYEYKSE